MDLYSMITTIVALLAKSGGCSIYEKAVVAASLINPSNNVAYLIVEDSSKRRHVVSVEDELEALPNENKSQLQQFETNNNQLSPGFLEINIALLHVSYGTGEAIFDILDNDVTLEKLKGGPQILLNGNGTSFSARTVIFWMLVTFSICACGCGCLIICVNTELDEPEEPQPRRPVRRRLTLEEVRSRFPSYHFNPDDHTQNGCCPDDGVCTAAADVGYMQVSDECTICLDEFERHVRVRKLPCGHVFHSTCIARWLVERHANCPLCKLDLYIEPEEEEEDQNSRDANEASPPEPQTAAFFWNSWFFNSSTEGYSQLEVPSGAAEQAEGLTPSGAVQEEPRSWWPFSLETVPSTDEDEQQQDESNDNRSSPRAISIAANALSSFWARNSSFLNRQRRRHSSRDVTESNLTELTEPLVPAAASHSTEEQEGIVAAPSLTQEEFQPPVSETTADDTSEI